MVLRKKLLMEAPNLRVAVCHYAPGERHKAHTDPHSRVSFLLRGGYHEESSSGAIRMRPGDILLKSERAEHEDRFGDEGAYVAAIEFLDNDPFAAGPAAACWRQRTDVFALRHVTAVLEAVRAGDLRGASVAGVDLVTASVYADEQKRRAPPWLEQLKLELEEYSFATIDVAARAQAAGAHPAHASRLFRQCYGSSITEHAHAHGIRRAIGALAQPNLSLSDAAFTAGFYDQSHMNRAFLRMFGRTPGMQRTLLTATIG
jgi:AraC family transcriptional regulator